MVRTHEEEVIARLQARLGGKRTHRLPRNQERRQGLQEFQRQCPFCVGVVAGSCCLRKQLDTRELLLLEVPSRLQSRSNWPDTWGAPIPFEGTKVIAGNTDCLPPRADFGAAGPAPVLHVPIRQLL